MRKEAKTGLVQDFPRREGEDRSTSLVLSTGSERSSANFHKDNGSGGGTLSAKLEGHMADISHLPGQPTVLHAATTFPSYGKLLPTSPA